MMVEKERMDSKERKKMKKLEEQADKRPLKDRVKENMKAASFTVDKMEKKTIVFLEVINEFKMTLTNPVILDH